jgi:hypothetical protein
MTLQEIAKQLEKFPGELTLSENTLLLATGEVLLRVHLYHEMFYMTLTKKEPREAIYGVTEISFTGLGEDLASLAWEFIVERLKELL